MKNKRIVRITPIWASYQKLRRASQKERLQDSHRLLDRPRTASISRQIS